MIEFHFHTNHLFGQTIFWTNLGASISFYDNITNPNHVKVRLESAKPVYLNYYKVFAEESKFLDIGSANHFQKSSHPLFSLYVQDINFYEDLLNKNNITFQKNKTNNKHSLFFKDLDGILFEFTNEI